MCILTQLWNQDLKNVNIAQPWQSGKLTFHETMLSQT